MTVPALRRTRDWLPGMSTYWLEWWIPTTVCPLRSRIGEPDEPGSVLAVYWMTVASASIDQSIVMWDLE